MIRTKSELGGDGVSHHRPTTDRSYIDKLVYHVGPIGRWIPRAESPSKVLFHSSHPSVHVVRVVLGVFKTKISVRICVIRGQIILLDFELNFLIISRVAIPD